MHRIDQTQEGFASEATLMQSSEAGHLQTMSLVGAMEKTNYPKLKI